MKPLIRLENVEKKFGEKILFQDLSIEFPLGQLIGITGKSGAGKTTLLNILSGIEPVDGGRLSVCGYEVTEMKGVQKTKFFRYQIAFLFQNFGLVDHETVRKNLEIALRYVRMTRHEKDEAMKSALESVGLAGFINRNVYELSGGEQQRVALARVALKPSKLVLCDEPTGNLDSQNKDIVLQTLLSFKNNGKTILVVTHDRDVTMFCDQKYHIQNNKLVRY